MTNQLPSSQLDSEAVPELEREEIHSFIVKIFLMRQAGLSKPVSWHGQVTHVPGGEKHSIRSTADLIILFSRYMEGWGVRMHRSSQLWRSVYLWLFKQ